MQSATYFHFSILGINPFCVQTGNVSHIFAWKVVSIHTVPAPRAHAAAAPRKVTSALPSLAARWAGGRGAEAPLLENTDCSTVENWEHDGKTGG